jgi:hypothetical protein
MLDPAAAEAAATQIITDFGPLEDRLPPQAAEALAWARGTAG